MVSSGLARSGLARLVMVLEMQMVPLAAEMVVDRDVWTNRVDTLWASVGFFNVSTCTTNFPTNDASNRRTGTSVS